MIAEDSGLLRELLAETLTSRGFEVAGQAATKPQVLDVVDAVLPDVVVLDIRLPPDQRDEGLQAARELRVRHPGIGLLMLSHYAETSYALQLLEHASHSVGYLVKDRVRDSDRLAENIRRIAAGEVVIDPEVVLRIMSRRRAADPLTRLTQTERQVLELMAEGRSNQEIARRLRCSPKTVEKHVSAITRKLDLPDAGAIDRPAVNVRVLAVLTYLRSAAEF